MRLGFEKQNRQDKAKGSFFDMPRKRWKKPGPAEFNAQQSNLMEQLKREAQQRRAMEKNALRG